MIKTILALVFNSILEAIKKELNNELLNLEDSVSKEKEKYEKLFEQSMLNLNKKQENIRKVLGVIKW